MTQTAQLTSRFSRHYQALRSSIPLDDDQLRTVAPSIFADNKHGSRSDRYTYIPTGDIVRGLRKQGFSPFMVCQSRVRDEGKREHAKHMLRFQSALFATKTLARLVDDILDVARGHNLSFQNQTVDLRRWFDQFTGSFASKVDSKKLKFVSVFSANCTHIEIDPYRLGQCVGNLLDNAIRYTDRGRIEIKVDLEVGKTPGAHEELCISVLDTGRGIGQDDLTRIFEPFERVTTPTSPSGMGLGLSIVANLAKGLGSSVEVSSQLSVGSQFTLRLPVSLSLLPLRPVGPSTSLVEPDAMLVIAKESAPDILVVDDDLDICRSVADVLRDGGYGCDTASNAEQALLKIEDHHYKVVLTDIQMPGLNGFEFAHLLTMSDNPPYVIAMTAYIEGFTNDPRSNHFRSKLKKPFEEEALLTQISIALDRY